MPTIRQQIIQLLLEDAMTALDISQAVGIGEKEAYRHLVHVQKTVTGQGGKLIVRPSTCQACGYTFRDRRRLTRPGRCPRCRQTRMDHPAFRIES